MNVPIQIAQMNVKVGNIKENTAKIKEIIFDSTSKIIIFPELCITGYTCGNLFKSDKFVKEAEEALEEIKSIIPEGRFVFLGSIRKLEYLYNSAFVLTNNKTVEVYDKIHLADANHHEDSHYFKSGTDLKTVEIEDIKIAPIICEDAWNTSRDLYLELTKENVDLVISLNTSYSSVNKVKLRKELFINKEYLIPTIYVNNVGMGDSVKNYLTYDGCSMIIENKDKVKVLDMYKEVNKEIQFNSKTKLFGHIDDIEEFDIVPNKYRYLSAIFGIENVFKLNGIKNAQVHMSGGVDSAVVGYLTVKALGKDNVFFVSQPSDNNGEVTKGNAQYEADKLGIELAWESIKPFVDTFKATNLDAKPIEIATFEATIRGSLGLARCHRNKAAMVSCGNFTEAVLGFETYLDVSFAGLIKPIADISKTDVFNLARYINEVEDDEIIPKGLYDGSIAASAELEDNKGADPFDYKIMSLVCDCIVRKNEFDMDKIYEYVYKRTTIEGNFYGNEKNKKVLEYIELAIRLVKITTYKRAQAPAGLNMDDENSAGYDWRDPLINGYR